MADIPPPPTWSQPNSPAWLDWYLTVARITQDTANTIESGLIGLGQDSATLTATSPAIDLLSLSYTSTGGVIIILASVTQLGSFNASGYLKLFRDSTSLESKTDQLDSGIYVTVPFVYAEQPSAGTYTYKVNVGGAGSQSLGNLIVLEIK